MASALSICNTALLMANANTINSFGDSTREAAMCNQFYETTRDALLSKHPWTFSMFEETLARTSEDPLLDDYEYVYQLPADVVTIRKTDQLGNEYRILRDRLFSNQTSVKVLYQKNPGEEFFPAYFTRVIEFRMAEILSLSLTQDSDMARAFQQQYLLSVREARGTDSQNTPNLQIQANELTLVSVRGDDT